MMSEKQMFGNKTRLEILILGYEKKKQFLGLLVYVDNF